MPVPVASSLRPVLLLCLCALAISPASADQPVPLGQIKVGSAPADNGLPVTVVTADDIRQWGAVDLADVLTLVPGTIPARGGDAGPAGLLPGLTGARETDDYLLVVDGVPLGSTTTPPFEAVPLTDVERIVIRRGPDPVIYGSAAFAGAIYLYHYPAGRSSGDAHASVGSYGSHSVDLSVALPSTGGMDQSLSAVASSQGYSDPRAGVERYQVFYRGALPVGAGRLSFDAGFLDLQQTPLSPTPVGDQGLGADVALDSNQNPARAHLGEYRTQLTLHYLQLLWGGNWSSTASLTHHDSPVVRGFLTDDYQSAGGGDNAEGFSQDERLNEAYLDSHWEGGLGTDLSLSLGANDMYGNGNAHSSSFGYIAPLTGDSPSAAEDPGEDSYARDRRSFFGIYAKSHWHMTGDLSLDLGLRESVMDERRFTDSDDDGPAQQSQRDTRLSSSAQLEWRAWSGHDASVTPYVAYADSFQPSQFDFSPDPEGAAILAPETARSWQLGLRGESPALEWELSLGRMDFGNAVVAEQQGGLPVFVNGGSDRFRDLDLDLSYSPTGDLRLRFSYEHVDARYLDFDFVDAAGDNVQLAGNHLPLTPRDRAVLGLSYGGDVGFSMALSAEYQGRRFLDPQNKVPAAAFTSYDCTLSYGFGSVAVYLRGENLTDRRDPVAVSEIGDGQVYRMLGRRVELGVSLKL